jgi:hypothetical protein
LLPISVSSPSSLYLCELSDWKAIKSLPLGFCQFSPRCNATRGEPIAIASQFESNDCILIQIKDRAGASCGTSGFLPPRRRRRSVYGKLNLLQSSRQVLGANLNRVEWRALPAPPVLPPNDSTRCARRSLHCGIQSSLCPVRVRCGHSVIRRCLLNVRFGLLFGPRSGISRGPTCANNRLWPE